jgi:FMN phosphatase YigB (HAD superfamily)
MQTFKNIIFDLGGIFMELDYMLTEKAFVDLGVTNFSDLYTQHHANPVFEKLETGEIEPAEFYDVIRNVSGLDLTDDQIKNAWNAMLLTFHPEKLEWLENIKSKYNIYLFSNTNQVHYDCFQEIFYKVTGHNNFDNYFIKAYYSHTLGLRKPYPGAFVEIMKRENLKPEETLFIDDTPKNVEGAKQAGLHTILLQSPETVFDLHL